MSKYFLWKVGSPAEKNEMVELTKKELYFIARNLGQNAPKPIITINEFKNNRANYIIDYYKQANGVKDKITKVISNEN